MIYHRFRLMLTQGKIFGVLLLSICPFVSSAIGQDQENVVPPSEFVDSVLTLFERHSYYSSEADWGAIRKDFESLTPEFNTTTDAYAPLVEVLRTLGDNHSFIVPDSARKEYLGQSSGASKDRAESNPSSNTDEESSNTPEDDTEGNAIAGIESRWMEGDIAYISVPSCGSADPEFCNSFATQLYDKIRALNKREPNGWIVDLRKNHGGNCWPMLAGVSPLLDTGKTGLFKSRLMDVEWGVGNGFSWNGSEATKLAKIDAETFELHTPAPKIAVIVGEGTASSGEVTAVAFRKNTNTRFFGSPTAGLTTANTTLTLSDGGMLALATALFVDREGDYVEQIAPDQNSDSSLAGDKDLETARTWLVATVDPTDSENDEGDIPSPGDTLEASARFKKQKPSLKKEPIQETTLQKLSSWTRKGSSSLWSSEGSNS